MKKISLFLILILNIGTLLAQTSAITITADTIIQDKNFTGRGNDNEVLLTVQLTKTGTSVVYFNQLVMNLNGTTDINDIEEIKIYIKRYNNTTFDSRNPGGFARVLATVKPQEGEMIIPLLGVFYADIKNLWVTCKVKETAKEGNKIDAEIISLTTSVQTYAFSNGNPAGNREILLGRKLLFAPGDYGSVSYRIPAITTAADGSIVTLTDKRKNGSGDLPANIDIVAKRSTDGGKTWSEPILIAEGNSSRGFGDAAIIKSNSGKLVALFVGNSGLWGSTPTNPIRTYMSTSADNGLTWTPPKDITPQIYGAECPDPVRSKWEGLFFGSGHALCTRSGRLMAVVAVREPGVGGLQNYAVYSDDDGETWKVSNRAIAGGDEAKVVELNNGDILMSSRTSGNRLWAKSSDGGITWGAKNSWTEIWGNACDADIVRFTSTKDGFDKDRILHTLPNAGDRRNVTMWVSYDEGTTWPVKKTVCAGTSAYSSVTILPDGTIGVYLEEDGSNPYKMYFLNFSLNWLTNGADNYSAAGTELVAQPEISLPSGKYSSPQTVTISSSTIGASIFYTLDGSTPTTNSTLYTGAITLENSCTLKAIAIKEGMANSVVSSAAYTIGYVIPTQVVAVGVDRYITDATTSGGSSNINYQATTPPASYYIYHNTTSVKADKGNSFTLNLTALPNQPDGLQWCQAIILVDWNQDYDFADTGERIAIIGNRSSDNSSTVLNISRQINVPATALEGKTRIRVVYTDAWRSTSYADLGEDPVHKGRVYDFDLIVNNPTSVKKLHSNSLTVYPNPFDEKVNLKFPETGKYLVSLLNLEGRTLFSRYLTVNSKGEIAIELDNFQSSTYLLKVKKENEFEITTKLIKK